MYKSLVNKESKLAVIGLGYVGLPLALEFAGKLKVIGYDINEERLQKMREGSDPCGELADEAFEGKDIEFTSSLDVLGQANFYVVAVPTPIDEHNKPDLSPLVGATKTVAKVLKRGDYVVYESTVYPGCTEEDCLPLLEKISGLKVGEDFKIGYSPERINPGEKVHTLPNTIKIVSGCDSESLDTIAKVYELVVRPGVHRAPSIKVAEAAKIIENTQRDVNIALMNELSIIFGRIGINTYDVLEAAGTKWNFLKFYPGLVGGHCIGVDPYYLVHKAAQKKYHPQIISAGRFINDTMGGYIAKKLVKRLISLGVGSMDARFLVLGITFKENVADIRNTKVMDIVNELKDYGCSVDITDSRADKDEVSREYGVGLVDFDKLQKSHYDAVIVAVAHDEYKELDEEFYKSLMRDMPNGVLADIKGLYRNRIKELNYWSL
ncbi:MAG: nucleotide sugar dehydrogenase [Bacteroidales bacterium]|nr:nucleotide sugar dehydrogenase [Bacteroidales bacterium]